MSPSNILKEGIFGFIAWTGIHWGISNLYVRVCTPMSGLGFLQTLYLSQSGYCNAFRWAHHTSASAMDQTFSIILAWSMLRLSCYTINYKKKNETVTCQ